MPLYLTRFLHRMVQSNPDPVETVLGNRRHTYRHYAVRVAQLVAYCREPIAGNECSRSVEFLEILPITGVGKVLETDLRKPFREEPAHRINQWQAQ